jgi:hypothetical protein
MGRLPWCHSAVLHSRILKRTRSLVEIRRTEGETVPPRLKPHCECCDCGTAKAVPLSKTAFFNKLLERQRYFWERESVHGLSSLAV